MYNTYYSCGNRRTCGCCTLLEQIAELLFGGTGNGCTTQTNGCGCNTCYNRQTQCIPVYGTVYLQTTGGFGTNGVGVNGQTGHGGCGCAFANANGFNTNGRNTCGYTTTYTRNTCGGDYNG